MLYSRATHPSFIIVDAGTYGVESVEFSDFYL
jgi:hypothetical protein